MRKNIRRFVSVLVFLCMAVSCAGIAFALEGENTNAERTLRIATREDFLAFAGNCRIDSYSQGLTVILERDIDLAGTDFSGIPIFCGSFEGGRHTVGGLSLTQNGSVQGLFRYLSETALVRELTVQGTVMPEGSRALVGGIAGQNAGRIEGCTFRGEVSGSDIVGGIVGRNTLTGVVEDCAAEGQIWGNHAVGGIAGENLGVLRGCSNSAQINTSMQQNEVALSDITVDSLLRSESADTTTDIGGIAGTSSGVIRDCENRGDVGYEAIGYNIGGIAGTQSGYLSGCKNYGTINGRKEIGGIVGQMEPVAQIEYSADTLQILQGQLASLSALSNRASSNAENSAVGINGEINVLRNEAGNAEAAVRLLLPEFSDGRPQLPDEDSVLSAQTNLSNSIGAVNGALGRISATTQDAAQTLSNDMRAVSNQINAMNRTIQQASENVGGSVEDVSDSDTEDDLTGKVEGCVNFGPVYADWNAGGVAGAIAPENDRDLQDDWQIFGETSLNFDCSLRAVILRSENRAAVTVKKQNAGGIAGWQLLGLIRDSVNTGTAGGEAAEYVGGISGQSRGFVRDCSAKCELTGDATVGGIAGSATIVSDCRSMVRLNSKSEKLGAVLGSQTESDAQEDAQEEQPVRGNVYCPVDADIGGIDGVSYAGVAQPLPLEEFLVLDGLPDLFRHISISFVLDDGEESRIIEAAPGEKLQPGDVPELPVKEGHTASWDGLEPLLGKPVYFDATVNALYTPFASTIESAAKRENGRPVLLVQGSFEYDSSVVVSSVDTPLLPESDATLLEAWLLEIPESEAEMMGRYLPPEDNAPGELLLLLQNGDGEWMETAFYLDGSCLVFPLAAGESRLAVLHRKSAFPSGGTVILLMLLAISLIWLVYRTNRRRRRKNA